MSCRYCRERLSAYLDSELNAEELEQVQVHLDACTSCHREYRALAETKSALACLGARVSRDEIERLLQTDVGEAVRHYASMPVSPRTVAAAILSFLGLWLATARLTGREDRHGAPQPDGAYFMPQEATPMAYAGNGFILSVVEVRPIPRLLMGGAETCRLVPMEASLMGPSMVYCAPVPRPVRLSATVRQTFLLVPSLTAH